MSPKTKKPTTDEALAALAAQDAPGPLDEHFNFATDGVMGAALNAFAAEFGGQGARSKAIRLLITKGAAVVVAERAERA